MKKLYKNIVVYSLLGIIVIGHTNLTYASDSYETSDNFVTHTPIVENNDFLSYFPHQAKTKFINQKINSYDENIETTPYTSSKNKLQELEQTKKEEEQKIEEKKQKEIEEYKKKYKKTSVKKAGQYAKVTLSDSDTYLLAQLIYLESGGCSYECQLAVGSVAVNLMIANNCDLSSLAHNKNVFSVAPRVDNATPSDLSLKAAKQIATSGTTVPLDVKCFRDDHYFSWAEPYMSLDNMYFGSY